MTKRQETQRTRRAGKASPIEEVKYLAEWDGKQGDAVEVLRAKERSPRLVGVIEYLRTPKEDGLFPRHGVAVLVRPFEGIEHELDCSEIVRKVEPGEWKGLQRQIQEKLPKSLRVYYQYRGENNEPVRIPITGDSPFQINAEDLSKHCAQISVDVLDGKGALLINNDKDKTRVLTAEELVVSLELFSSTGDPIRDPKSKRAWTESLGPYNLSKSEQFNTGKATKLFTPLLAMLAQHLPKNCRAFRLDISLLLRLGARSKDHAFTVDLEQKIEAIKCERHFEISAGKIRAAACKFTWGSKLCRCRKTDDDRDLGGRRADAQYLVWL